MVEILIVIAVIGFLLSVVLPNLVSVQRRSRDEKAVGEVGVIEQSLYKYRQLCKVYPLDISGTFALGTNGLPSANNGLPGVSGGVCPNGVTLGSLLPAGFKTDWTRIRYYGLVRGNSIGTTTPNKDRCTSFYLGVQLSGANATPINRTQSRGWKWEESNSIFNWKRCGTDTAVSRYGADVYEVVIPSPY